MDDSFALQTALIASNRPGLHRRLGNAGGILASGIVGSISPARLIQPFLLLLTPAIPVGMLMYFASVNIQRPKTFSLLLALSTSITLLVFQFSFLHFGSEFGFITGGLRTIWIPVALLVAAVVPTIIFFRCKQRLEAKFGGGSD